MGIIKIISDTIKWAIYVTLKCTLISCIVTFVLLNINAIDKNALAHGFFFKVMALLIFSDLFEKVILKFFLFLDNFMISPFFSLFKKRDVIDNNNSNSNNQVTNNNDIALLQQLKTLKNVLENKTTYINFSDNDNLLLNYHDDSNSNDDESDDNNVGIATIKYNKEEKIWIDSNSIKKISIELKFDIPKNYIGMIQTNNFMLDNELLVSGSVLPSKKYSTLDVYVRNFGSESHLIKKDTILCDICFIKQKGIKIKTIRKKL
jgi:hypothetical protein